MRTTFFLFLTSFCFAETPPASGPLVWYDLTTNVSTTVATDLSGNGNNGTISLGTIPWNFSGYSTAKVITLAASIIPTTTASIVVVTNLNADPASNVGACIFGTSAGTAGFSDACIPYNVAGTKEVIFDFGNNSSFSTGNARLTSSSIASDQAWHTWVFTVTSGAMAIYLDGTQVASGTTNVTQNATGNLVIGAQNSALGNPFKGMIADFAIYSRVLNSTEITAWNSYPGNPEPRNQSLVNLAPNGLSALPSMGWGSWLNYGNTVTEANIKAQADAMVSTGLAAVGYKQIGIDGGKVTRVGSAVTLNATNFPDGGAAIGTYIHGDGETFWFYGAPGTTDCQAQSSEWGHETGDALTYASWGVDWYKYDWCFAQNSFSAEMPWTSWPQYLYQFMGQQLRATGRPMIYGQSSLNETYLIGTSWLSWASVNAGLNFNRDTDDVFAQWSSMMINLEGQVGLQAYGAPGNYLDPDYIVCGLNGVTDPSGHGAGTVTDAQCQAQFSLWSVLAAPLNIAFDMTAASSNTMATVSNLDAINIDQDSMGLTGQRISSTACGSSFCEVWARRLSGACAIALLNRDTASHSITATFATIAAALPACGSGPYATTLNVWANWPTCTANHCGASMGTLTTNYSTTVAGTSAVLFTVGTAPLGTGGSTSSNMTQGGGVSIQ